MTKYALRFCWFPVIGLVIGTGTGAVFYILTEWQVGSVFRGPPDGGALYGLPADSLHGFMDTTDAQVLMGTGKETDDPERSHGELFAVIGCGVYMMLSVGHGVRLMRDGIRIMVIMAL